MLTFDDLAGLLVDVPALADNWHHALDLLHLLFCAMALLEGLPNLQQGNTL